MSRAHKNALTKVANSSGARDVEAAQLLKSEPVQWFLDSSNTNG